MTDRINKSYSNENCDNNQMTTPHLNESFRNHCRSFENLDPRPNLILHRFNTENGPVTFAQPTLPPEFQQFISNTPGLRNFQVREFHYNISFDDTEDLSGSYLQPSLHSEGQPNSPDTSNSTSNSTTPDESPTVSPLSNITQTKMPQSTLRENKKRNDAESNKKTKRKFRIPSTSSSDEDEFNYVKHHQNEIKLTEETNEMKNVIVKVKPLSIDDMSCGSSCSTITSDEDDKFFQAARFNKLREEKKLKHRQQKLKNILNEYSYNF